MQIALGRDYFRSRFGRFPRVAYNVDTFGHAASLPGILRRFGQDRYVMMRPQEHELCLPAQLFRWRGFEGEDGVTVFRIARHYGTGRVREEHILASLEDLPEGVSHTMCFIGLGDMEAARRRRDRVVSRARRSDFGLPTRVFVAVALFRCGRTRFRAIARRDGELQHHAVGCYSVTRALKVGLRNAEHLLAQAEFAGADPSKLQTAWEFGLFQSFPRYVGWNLYSIGLSCTRRSARRRARQGG